MWSTFARIDAWLIAMVLAAAMFVACGLGWWSARRSHREGARAATKFDDASLALFGLLLAFTFSMALAKHEQRRTMVITDSNAIGDFYTCISLLDDPLRSTLQGVVREYTQLRIDIARKPPDEASLEGVLRQFQHLHARMTTLVAEAVHQGTPIAVPLANTLNEVTSSHAALLAAFRDRLPTSIALLLFLAAIVSVALVGRGQETDPAPYSGGAVGFILLVTLAVYVTLDLNQPTRGLITVSVEPLERVLSSMTE